MRQDHQSKEMSGAWSRMLSRGTQEDHTTRSVGFQVVLPAGFVIHDHRLSPPHLTLRWPSTDSLLSPPSTSLLPLH